MQSWLDTREVTALTGFSDQLSPPGTCVPRPTTKMTSDLMTPRSKCSLGGKVFSMGLQETTAELQKVQANQHLFKHVHV